MRPMAKSRGSLTLPKAARDQSEERGLRQHEAGPIDQENLRDESETDPNKRAAVKAMLAARRGVVGDGVAPAAAERFVEQPYAEQDQTAGDHRGSDIRSHLGVTTGAGHLRSADGNRDAQDENGHGKNQLGGFGLSCDRGRVS